MTKIIAQAHNGIRENRIQVMYIALAACACAVVLYAVSLYQVIARSVALQNIRTQTSQLTQKVDVLDAQYASLSNSITPDNLAKFGLASGQVSAYIPRSASLGSVALRGHEL